MIALPMNVEERLNVAYFGCDAPWAVIACRASRRRNSAILKAFADHESIASVFVFNYVLRFQVVRSLLASPFRSNRKIEDVFITNVFPERWIGSAWRRFNRWLMAAMIYWQVGSFDEFPLLVWCYWPAGYLVAKRTTLKGVWVFDADHNILHDDNRSAGTEDEIKQVLGEVVRQADLVVAASRSMLEWFKQNGAHRFFLLRNGVDPSRFARRPPARNPRQPRIGYVGTLSQWMDYPLLQEVATLRPQWKFAIAGPVYQAELSNKLRSASNIEFLGPLKPDELPDFLATVDIALGLYRKGPGSDVDSMKLFEYLAAGVPVVTTPFHDHLREDYDNLLILADDANAFVHVIEQILHWDEPTRRAWDDRCARFIERNTWNHRANEAIQLVQESLA